MKMKKESGLTMTMLVVTIIVMLVLASVVTYYTINRNHLISNGQQIKLIEEIGQIKDKIEEDEVMKQTLAGDGTVVLSQAEINNILGEYKDSFVVVVVEDSVSGNKRSVLKYVTDDSRFSEEDKESLREKLDIQPAQ